MSDTEDTENAMKHRMKNFSDSVLTVSSVSKNPSSCYAILRSPSAILMVAPRQVGKIPATAPTMNAASRSR